jgi:hypothetical protein
MKRGRKKESWSSWRGEEGAGGERSRRAAMLRGGVGSEKSRGGGGGGAQCREEKNEYLIRRGRRRKQSVHEIKTCFFSLRKSLLDGPHILSKPLMRNISKRNKVPYV